MDNQNSLPNTPVNNPANTPPQNNINPNPINELPEKKGIPMLWSVVILIVVALVAVGGVFAYQYFATQQTPVVEPVVTQTDLTADWKTYENAQAGYSISYPNNTLIDTSDPTCVGIQNGSGSIYINNGYKYNGSRITCGGTTGLGIGNVRTTENVDINNQKYLAEGFVDPTSHTGFLSFTFTDKVSVTYQVNMDNYAPSITDQQYNDAMSLVKQILSTLKSPSTATIPLAITSPIGGEILKEGQMYTIKWTGGTGNYNIYVTCNRAIMDEGSVGSAKASEGAFQWKIRNFTDITSSAECRLAFSYSFSEFSLPTIAYSNYFTITP